MDPKDLKLPFVDEVFQVNPDLEKIWKILWRVDPARLHKVPDEVISQLIQIDLEYTVQSARLEAQLKVLQAETLEKISQQITAGKILSH